MTRRQRWRKVLDTEIERWSQKTCQELRTQLQNGAEYEVNFDSVAHQVEVEILEDTPEYVHISVAVDDGTLPQSIFPVTHSFICTAN